MIIQVNKSKCPGVTIDSHLSWSDHISSTYKAFSSNLAFLIRILFFPQTTLEEIYFKTIIPSVSYEILVWGACLESKFLPLEKLHARAARTICKLERGISSEQAISTNGWMALSYIFKKMITIFMHNW